MRDKIHSKVRRALEKDDWRIAADPFRLKIGKKKYIEIDLEAEKVIIAEKENIKIFVEIKSISGASILYQFYAAYGQYEFYRDKLEENDNDQALYLAISKKTHDAVIEMPELSNWLEKHEVNLLIVNLETETIEKWIKY